MLDQHYIKEYEEILKEELLPTQGCTEPIALAYAAAKVKQLLGTVPERVSLVVSGNIVKNVKSVTVPNMGGLKGIEASIAAGFIGGNADAVLEVVADISQEKLPAIREYMAKDCVTICVAPAEKGTFYIDLTAFTERDQARIVLEAYHTNITRVEKNGEVLLEKAPEKTALHNTDRSLPILAYGAELKVGREKLLRALALSDLITIHQKTSIGSLSAFCAATCAGCGAAAGIAYLYGGDYEAIAHTITNTLAILSGMICDGAKPSCAAKISMAVEAGIVGFEMYRSGKEFCSGEGILAGQVEETIANVGKIARDGMRETDHQILDIMVQGSR